jgi:hypothetical protein
MKKVVILALIMVLVLSGIASAMAFEAHKVNVKAHVENAITVPLEVDLGTVFPQEWVTGKKFDIHTSSSFCAGDQDRVHYVYYTIAAHHKVDEQGEPTLPWLPGLYIRVENPAEYGGLGPWMAVPEPAAFCNYTIVTRDFLHKIIGQDGNLQDWIHIGLDVPVFAGYYNEALEDYLQINKPRPDERPFPEDVNVPSGVLDVPGAGADVGADYGVDLWIQVTSIEPDD